VRIAFLTSSLHVGGIEVNLVRLVDELHRRGHEVTVAAGPGVLVDDVRVAGADYVEVTLTHRRPVASLRSVLAIRRMLRVFDPDVVHVFSASSAAILWPAVHLRGRGRRRPPVISTIMGLKMSADESELKTLLRAWGVALGADRLIITAPAIGAAVARLPIRRRRLVEAQVVGLPVPEGEIAPADLHTELGLAPGTSLVVTIGRLAPDKSHHLFLEAAALVQAQRDDIHFVVVGGGRLRDDLERRLDELDVRSTATLLGERHDVDAILRAATVCVKPGVVEGFVGMTVLEAQLQGVPVVAFDTQDVRLAIDDGRSGLIVRAGDVAALAQAIMGLVDDEGRAAAVGEAGRRDVEADFSMPVIVDGLLRIYEEAQR
jgi:glycosyltransferase involved in cell wall biosynthesis